jgi:glutamine---fructose-6-phosphate transaminase (isomerizing)
MCGIIGYTGRREALEILLDGLRKLEYRGYDSAGVAIVGSDLQVHKEKGEISVLERNLPPLRGKVGIGHTRWATCGKPSKENAHPFIDCRGDLALVHNGVIENSAQLRRQLVEEGHVFTSETDTEVLVHLLEKYYDGDMRGSLSRMLKEVSGTYAVVALRRGSNEMVAARKENPLVIGLGVGENFLASDVTALLSSTSKVIYMLDGDTALVTPERVRIFDAEENEIQRETQRITWTMEDAQKGGFEHFMLKEIHEQPTAVHNTLLSALEALENGSLLGDLEFDSVKIIACGTSFHAGLIGKYLIEELTSLPVTVDLASEYRYSTGVSHCPLVILISQSGETADTLAAMREAKQRGCHTLAVCNVVGSTLARESAEVFYTQAGPEIGVAATKTFTTQLVAMMLLAMRMAYLEGKMPADTLRGMLSELRTLPVYIRSVLDISEKIQTAADMLTDSQHVFFIGRNINYPTMLEGALKLKEISYIHAEGYAAGELKHGPLALIDKSTPIVAACVSDRTYEKMLSNISEVLARDAPVLAIGYEGDEELPLLADRFIGVPRVPPLFTPIILSVVLQLLAYHTARKRGCEIDKPRNLAKSVTVE